MEIDAAMRRRVHARFEELMGPEMADAVMDMFPPAGWRGVATRDDVERLGVGLRGELRGEIARLEGQVAELRGEVRGDVAELRGQVARSEGRMLEEFGKLHRRFARTYVVNALSMVGVAGLVLTAVRFG